MLSNHIIDQKWNYAALYRTGKPFHHVVIDDFFRTDVAEQIAAEFPSYDDPSWYQYDNNLELKKITNNYNMFGPTMYKAFHHLNIQFLPLLRLITGIDDLHADIGLHGGGMHMHARGGKLNVHKDYSIHPKLKMLRKLNLIIYLTPEWDVAWGGGLELHDDADGQPGTMIKRVDCKFNRAILFDTTQKSWHGLPDPIDCPVGTVRQSMAIYYLTTPDESTDPRQKALYAPHKDQKDDPNVMELIRQRADEKSFDQAYRKKV